MILESLEKMVDEKSANMEWGKGVAFDPISMRQTVLELSKIVKSMMESPKDTLGQTQNFNIKGP